MSRAGKGGKPPRKASIESKRRRDAAPAPRAGTDARAGSDARGRADARADADAPAAPADAAASAAASASRLRRRAVRAALAALALVVAGGVAFWLMRPAPSLPAGQVAAGSAETGVARAVAASASSPAYVDNALCAGCHADAASRWQQSHHFMAMATPAPDTVRGDFGNTSFRHAGVTTRFFRRDGKYFVNTDGPDGAMADFEVKYTFGVDPLQQYLIALPGGRLQPLTIAWDTRKRRWFHLYPHEKAPPGDVMHWTGRYQTANTMCIACHTTGYDKRYDAAADNFDTRWKEANVSCQACHGPGEAHVAWANARGSAAEAHATAAASGVAVPAAAASAPRFGLTMDFATAGAAAQVDVCAACHSRRSELTGTQTAGTPLYDEFMPARLDAGLYHADGQQDAEVYVYGSFRQSRMYAHGVRCSDCHDAHTLALKAPGNGVCLQCHRETPNSRFPSAAGTYDTPAHHHHKAGSAGAQCVACHMPSATYMQVHARPDHSLRIPRPDLDAATGAPDACTACHKGKPPAWAAKAIDTWFGPQRRPHYGTTLAAARAAAPGADAQLAALAADAAQPAIVRATAIAALRAYPGAHDDVRLAATRDADPAVRSAAADSFESAAPAQRVRALAPLLSDPLRGVRTSASRSLAGVDRGLFDAAQARAFDAALAEYVAAQNIALDMPGARLNLAVVYERTGEPALAEANYLAALKIDPDFTPARANLAQFYAARGRPQDAERVLADGMKRVPQQGDLQYALGLVLAEQGKLPEAADALAKAAKLLPDRARVHYNLGLALQQTGRPREAERALQAAERLSPRDSAVPYALAVLYAQQQRYDDALAAARQAQQLAPDDPQLRELVLRLQAQQRPGG